MISKMILMSNYCSIINAVSFTALSDLEDRRKDPYGQVGSSILITNASRDFYKSLNGFESDAINILIGSVIDYVEHADEYNWENWSDSVYYDDFPDELKEKFDSIIQAIPTENLED